MAVFSVNHSTTPTGDRDLWRTPPSLFLDLLARFGPFDIDAAANEDNWLVQRWFGPGGVAPDALAVPSWREHMPLLQRGRMPRAWLNPPYSRGLLGRFVAKACEQAHWGFCDTVLLIPAATDTQWWHECLWSTAGDGPRLGVQIHFLRGRVRFRRPDGSVAGSPTFGSAVVLLNAERYRNQAVAAEVGQWTV